MSKLFDVILNDLRSSGKQVTRLLAGGVLFAFACHVYIVEPYFRHKAQERHSLEALIERTNAVQKLAREVDRIRPVSDRASATLLEIRQRIDEYPDHLRNLLPDIRTAVESRAADRLQQSAPRIVGRFQWPHEITSFPSGVRWYVETWFKQLAGDLESGVVQPVSQLEMGAIDSLRSNAAQAMQHLRQYLDQVDPAQAIQHLRQYLDQVDPEFWQSYGQGKVPVAEELKHVVEAFFGPVERAVSGLLKESEAKVRNQEDQLQQHLAALETVRRQRDLLESRLQSLESPLGRLPLGLTDLITLFPLLLAVVVAMIAAGVQRAARLCVALREKLPDDEPSSRDEAFAFYADCWFLPPYRGVMQPVFFGAGLLILLAIFGRAVWLVTGGPDAFAFVATELEALRGNLLLGAYAAGMVVLGASLWRLQRAIRIRPCAP